MLDELLRLGRHREDEELVKRNVAANSIYSRLRITQGHAWRARRRLARDCFNRDISIVVLRLQSVLARLFPVLWRRRRGGVRRHFHLLAKVLRLRERREDKEVVRRIVAVETLQAKYRNLVKCRAAHQKLARDRFD